MSKAYFCGGTLRGASPTSPRRSSSLGGFGTCWGGRGARPTAGGVGVPAGPPAHSSFWPGSGRPGMEGRGGRLGGGAGRWVAAGRVGLAGGRVGELGIWPGRFPHGMKKPDPRAEVENNKIPSRHDRANAQSLFAFVVTGHALL